MAKKDHKIKLISTAKKVLKNGKEVLTGHFYTTTKNKKNTAEKLELKRFDPVVRQHVSYKEAKIK